MIPLEFLFRQSFPPVKENLLAGFNQQRFSTKTITKSIRKLFCSQSYRIGKNYHTWGQRKLLMKCLCMSCPTRNRKQETIIKSRKVYLLSYFNSVTFVVGILTVKINYSSLKSILVSLFIRNLQFRFQKFSLILHLN